MEALLAAGASDYSAGMNSERVSERGQEAEWIERAKRADQAAFELLYRRHVDRVYGLCLRMTANVAEAEDCTQEAFIQAWRKLGKFRGDSAFGTWLHRVAVNTVLGRMRKQRRDQDRFRTADAAEMESPAALADPGELRDLSKAVEKLPEGARHVFVLYAVYGYSHDEAAGMLGIAPGTSKAQLHRARRLLAQQLDNESIE